jgi:hypothetical protein
LEINYNLARDSGVPKVSAEGNRDNVATDQVRRFLAGVSEINFGPNGSISDKPHEAASAGSYPRPAVLPHFAQLVVEDPIRSDGGNGRDQGKASSRGKHLNRYDFAFATVALLGIALILIGSYRRSNGVAVILIWGGLVALCLGLGSILGYQSIY